MEQLTTLNADKLRRLYVQATSQQWSALEKLNFKSDIQIEPEVQSTWSHLGTVFYTLEKMGLNVLTRMIAKAARKLESEEVLLYLTMQCADEARHVFAIETYLKKLGKAPRYERKYHVLGQLASIGFFQVENWLFSTLFSENFASSFLRRAKAAHIDPLGAEMFRQILIDESRHIHFLHLVIPEMYDRMSLFSLAYVKTSQFFVMEFSEKLSRTLTNDAQLVGIDRRSLLEEVYENMEKAYSQFGIPSRFLHFPKIKVIH